MQKVKVTIPAACNYIGPGIDSLGLALTLHNTVEMIPRADSAQRIAVEGEGSTTPFAEHPVIQAANALFQDQKQSAGFDVICTGEIPAASGLGAETAWIVGGIVAANNLLGSPLTRDQLLVKACELSPSPAIVTAILGGLIIVSRVESDVLYRRLEIADWKIVVGLPARTDPVPRSEKVDLADAIFNIGRTALVIDALRRGDGILLGKALEDRLVRATCQNPDFERAAAEARRAGAAAVTVSGEGPALIAFILGNPFPVQQAFEDALSQVRTWVLNIDTQGIAISLRQ